MAKRFRFRLEAVRRVRERARDAQRRVVAVRLADVAEVENRILTLTDRSEAASDELARMQRTGLLDTTAICRQHAHRDWLIQSILGQQGELAERQQELINEQERLAEASKQLKVIEKLRERQEEAFRRQLAREEQASTDEAGLQMYLRRAKRTDKVPI